MSGSFPLSVRGITASAPPPIPVRPTAPRESSWKGEGGGWSTSGIPVYGEVEGIDFDQVAVPGILCDSDVVVRQFPLYALSVDVFELGLTEPKHRVPLHNSVSSWTETHTFKQIAQPPSHGRRPNRSGVIGLIDQPLST